MEDIKDYLEGLGFKKNLKVLGSSKGESNDVFFFEHDKCRYVLRRCRNDVPSEDRLYNEFVFLSFLESENIDFVPKSIHYDKNVHIVSFVGERDVQIHDLSEQQLEKVISNWSKIHFLDTNKFVSFSNKNNFKIEEPYTPLSTIKKFGIDRFEYIKKNCADKELIDWISPRLAKNVELIKKLEFNYDKFYFAHGDLGANIRIDKSKIWFIDWEWGKLTYTKNPAYTLVHDEGISDEQRNKIMELYSHYFKIPKNELQKDTIMHEQVIMVNDVIWATKRYAEMKLNKMKNYEKYYQLILQRMRKYESRFEK